MAALERIADVLEEVFRAAGIERLLSPKAVVQIVESPDFRPAANGQDRTFSTTDLGKINRQLTAIS